MGKRRISSRSRLLALVLVIAMVVCQLPVFAVAAESQTVTFTVVDSGNAPVAGAQVSCSVNEGELLTGVTGEDGVCTISAEVEGMGPVSVSYSVTAEGYETASGTANGTDIRVTLTEEVVVETVTVSVSNGQGGVVTVNGSRVDDSIAVEKDAPVTVVVTPDPGYGIESLSIGGQETTVALGEACSLETSFAADTEIEVTYTQVSVVTVNAANAAVTLNGTQTNSLTVKTGSEVTVSIASNSGYIIDTVKIGDTETPVSGSTYTTTVTADRDITIVAGALQLFSVTVTYDENGTVTVDGEKVASGGSVSVVEGTEQVTVVASADTENGYEIGSITVNGKETAHNNGEVVLKNIHQDQVVVVTFALRVYTVTANTPENGTVEVVNSAEHGSEVTVTITADTGYDLTGVSVNGTELIIGTDVVFDETTESYSYTMTVMEDVAIDVAFTKTADSSASEITIDSTNLVHQSGNVYVFKKGTSVTISINSEVSDAKAIRLVNKYNQRVTGDWSSKDITLSGDYTIADGAYKLQLRKGYSWSNVNETYIIVFDSSAPSLTVTPKVEKEFYSSDVTLTVAAGETGTYYSGIKSVTYSVVKDGDQENPTQTGAWTCDATGTGSVEETVIVKAADNNSDNVVIYVTVEDYAGNTQETTYSLKINSTPPALTSIETVDVSNAEAESGYYTSRVITLTITDRASTFNQNAVKIDIQAVDAANEQVNVNPSISWQNNGDTHVATIVFSEDGCYTWSISYENKAGMSLAAGNAAVSVDDAFAFTVDGTAPTGTVKFEEYVWEDLLSNLTFGIWKNSKIEVSASGADATSPISSVLYYKSDDETILDGDALDALYTDAQFTETPVTVDTDDAFVVYVRIMDAAGNVTYLSTAGLGVDLTAPTAEFNVMTEAGENGFYTGDVEVAINVVDPAAADGSCSGLATVTYEVYSLGEKTQEGVIECEDYPASVTDTITVDSSLNNSNDVKVVVYATDRAGNEMTPQETSLMIDTTAPEVHVAYDNNEYQNESYYADARKATITVYERNFDPELFEIVIETVHGSNVTISDWTTESGKEGGNGDDTAHTMTILYSRDDDYTFSISGKDLAGWQNDAVISESSNPYAFTIDQTAPVVTVTYDNNSAANEKYFNAVRTATVTVVEHNFDAATVDITADRGGVVPEYTWNHAGDTHTAVIAYTVDGDYTFGISVQDKAGNMNGAVDYGASAAANEFVIDTDAEMVTYSGVETGKAYGSDDSVIPSIEITDINLDTYTVTLVGVQKDATIDLTAQAQALISGSSETVTGLLDLFEAVQEKDGIYTLTIQGVDLAGNVDEQTVVFTVNRFGSVYVYNDTLMDLIADGGYFVQSVDEDIVITEYNADKLLSGSLIIEITRDGKPLETVIYTVTPDINDLVEPGESGWYQYTYTISKENFEADGVYKISVSSQDATGNKPENSNYEGMTMTFRVDTTAPEITSVVGLEEAIVNATELTVKYTVYDTMGIQSVKVYVDGVLVDEITDFSADLNNYTGSFTLSESSDAQHVQIVVVDLAGNATDTDSENFASAYEFNKDVTVSTNFFVRWYANQGVFWGSIGGIAAGLALLWFLLFGKKKKEGK